MAAAAVAAASAIARLGRADAPAGRYTVNAGTVYDNKTKLTWQRAVAPGTFDWNGARQYCASLALAGSGWRLPSMNELVTLVDYSRSNPAIDPAFFPDTPTDVPYWTSSPLAGDSTQAWYVSALVGNVFYTDTTSSYHARCVR